VFGEGAAGADLLFVGEQPGDREDRAGRPFVGPAGQIFDKALAEAGVDRSTVYVTNAVKHFKFEPGKRRLHKSPNGSEIAACRPWPLAEIEAVNPRLVVALGATAAQSLTGRPLRVGASLGKALDIDGGRRVIVAAHPSALLRILDPALRQPAFAQFVETLRGAAAAARGG
jgi:DNA polymerase